MLNLFSQNRAQAMIIHNHGVQLYAWQNKTLTFQATFTDSPESLNQFSQAIVTTSATPLIIISNLMEESFLNETIAHVTGNDRVSLLERKLSYAFRSTPYRVAKVTDRELDGRRDDKVLLSALSKPELLKPWIKILLDKKVPIQGISSSAYLTEVFVQGLNTKSNKEEILLVVSLEKGSELRQTFLKQGKILFSRVSILQAVNAAALPDIIYNESLQIRNYLERIKAIKYDDVLKIHVYSTINSNDFSTEAISTNLNIFENYNTSDLAANHKLEMKSSELNVSTLFLSHALQKNKIRNIYAPFNIRRYFHLNTISKTLLWSSALLILAFISFQIPTVLNIFENIEQQQQLESQTLPLTTEYEVLSRRFPETPIPSEEMALVVESYEKIKQQSYLPTEAIGFISEALTSSPNLELNSIKWELLEGSGNVASFQGLGAQPSGGLGSQPVSPASIGNSIQLAILENRTNLRVTISGLVFSPDSYREAQNQVLTFSNALDAHPRISVNPIKMPTDVRTDIAVEAVVDGEELQSEFILELSIEEAE